MKDVMLDLETLGTNPGCVVLSIGAVAFDAEGIGPEFHVVVRTKDSQSRGLTIEADTLAWWLKQDAEAHPTLHTALDIGADYLTTALQSFNDWLAQFGADVRVWGNGANFDQPILLAAYRAAQMRPAWKFWNDRCYRTLKSLYPQVPLIRTGVHHNAVDDARTQAVHASAILRAMNA